MRPRASVHEEASTSTEAQLSPVHLTIRRWAVVRLRSLSARYVAGVLLLALAYYTAAKLGQTLRYTASVSAIWPPTGLGIAALYLWGLRWWPGVFIAELVVNAELLAGDAPLPLGSLIGQQAGNMAEIVLGALLLGRLIGRRAKLDRVDQVGAMLVALACATAISATTGTVSMVAGGVIEASDVTTFWRTWWLGDTSGGLVVLPFMLAWAQDPHASWRCMATWEGALLLATVGALGMLAVSTDEPVTYMVFPALIWAALRFGAPGATLAIAIAAGVAIGVTANDLGPFFKQPIDHRTLSTQAYIAVAALTTLFLSAVVSERERSSMELAEARLRVRERTLEERHRIARDLHDSVSQSLFSSGLHARSAQKALKEEHLSLSSPLGRALSAIVELTRDAQNEMRALVFELRGDSVEDGLVAALDKHASRLRSREGLAIDVTGPDRRLALSRSAEGQLFAVAREALSNVLKHADAGAAQVIVENRASRVLVEVRDDGCGFDPTAPHPYNFGIESMRSRTAEIGGLLTITSAPGRGTVVRVEAPAQAEEARNGN